MPYQPSLYSLCSLSLPFLNISSPPFNSSLLLPSQAITSSSLIHLLFLIVHPLNFLVFCIPFRPSLSFSSHIISLSLPTSLTWTLSPLLSLSSSPNSDGPSEAEVRDGGKSPHGGDGEDGDTANDPLFGALEVPSVLAAALGAGCGLLLLGILLIILLVFRGRRRRRREEQAHQQTTPSPSSSWSSSSLVCGRCLSLGVRSEAKGRTPSSRAVPSRSESTAAMLSPGHGDTCLERDMQVREGVEGGGGMIER